MSLQRPQEVDIPDPDLQNDLADDNDSDAAHDDAERDVVEHGTFPPEHLPDDADPADAYEQSLVVDYDEDDYR